MSGPTGWRNFDSSPTLRFERIPLIGRLYTKNERRFPPTVEVGDIVKGLPLAPESCRVVYCSHVLEHLALEEFRIALRQTAKILEPGGVFRLVVPDLEYYARQYLGASTPDAAQNFLLETRLGRESRKRSLRGFLGSWLGGGEHLWMWDYRSMKKELGDAGFVEIRRAKFGDSPDPMFREVEELGRWENCLGVECRKAK